MATWTTSPPEPTTPTEPPPHGATPPRGLEEPPSSRLIAGRFGRMFRNLPVFELADEKTLRDELEALAKRIVQPAEEDKPLDAEDEDQNPDIPAGYTYLGQFIDHDITFDPVSSLQRQNDPDALDDFRTPRLDLDSVYGRGPADQPYLYEPPPEGDPAKLALGRSVGQGSGEGAFDLPRLGNVALIGDPRNDENLIVSQLQSVFLRFHNAVVDVVRDRGFTGNDVFKEAQRLTRWHYQWVVVHDFLARHVVGPEIVDDILRPKEYVAGPGQTVSVVRPELVFYDYDSEPFMPVEFSVAAYRFGHSMVRPSYFINDFLRGENNEKRFPIFSGNREADNRENLNGFRPLPDEWGFEWKFFFRVSDEEFLPQPSYRIDDELVNPLGALPLDPPAPGFESLALRNLMRGVKLGLPAGETVARAMGITPLSDEELALGDVAPSFVGHAPLWYYVLREASIRADGRRLGPVGGRIVAEVLIGLVKGDPLSYLRVQPGWRPELGSQTTPGDFTMADVVRVAGAA
jgi:hypothetical protein